MTYLRRSSGVLIVVLALVVLGIAIFLFMVHPMSGTGSTNMTVSTSP